jgi:hypothetical protein
VGGGDQGREDAQAVVTFSWCSSTTQAATQSFTPSDARSKRPRPQGGSAFQKSQTVKSLTARRRVLNSYHWLNLIPPRASW